MIASQEHEIVAIPKTPDEREVHSILLCGAEMGGESMDLPELLGSIKFRAEKAWEEGREVILRIFERPCRPR